MVNVIRTVLILTCLLVHFNSDAQIDSQHLFGNWIIVNVENVNPNFHFNKNDPVLKNFSSYRFVSPNQLRISNSPYDVGNEVTYSITNGNLVFNTQILQISLLTDSLLILEDTFKSDDILFQAKRYYYHKQEYLLRNMELPEVLICTTDSLIISPTKRNSYSSFSFYQVQHLNSPENYIPMPLFNYNNHSFEKYFQDNINIIPNKKIESKSKFSFVVDKDGKVSDIEIISGENEKLNNAIIKVIKSTKNKWLPASYDGIEKASTMIFDLRLASQASLQNEYRKPYEEGNKYFDSGDFRSAINLYTKAISKNQRYLNAYFNRAAAYYQLEELDNACHDWTKIYEFGEMSTYLFLVEFCGFE